ncbi:MAG: acyl-CoA dehydrogenase family protein [Pirellulales bacterium]
MPQIYRLDPKGRELAEVARKLAQEVAARHAADVDGQARFPREAIQALAAEGFFGLCLPADAGGLGQPPRVFAAVAEQLAEFCASTAMVYVMHVAAAQVPAASPTLAGRKELLAEIAAGRHLTTLAFSERGSRSQFWNPVSKIESDGAGGGCTTSANKSWVTSASHADSYVASGQKPGAQSPRESTLYLVRRGAAGVQPAGRFDGLGLRGNDSAPVVLTRYSIPAGDLLTEHGGGLPMMLQVVLPWFVVGTAAMAHGLCRAAVAATAGHLSATRFEHDGSQLRDLPNLRARLAEMSVRTEQSRALLAYTTASMEDPDESTPLYVLEARMAALDAAQAVTDLAMKACGGAAFSKQLGIERLFRDARAGWVMAPTGDHLEEFIGRALTGLPLL